MTTVDDLIQESRDRMMGTCGCWQRVRNGNADSIFANVEPLWHLCAYHDGMEDAFADRAAMLRALEATQIGWQHVDDGWLHEPMLHNCAPYGEQRCQPVYLILGEPTA